MIPLRLGAADLAKRLAIALAGTAASAGLAAGPATGAPSPLLAHARLQGSFLLAGRVTVADNIPGEHVGDTVQRIWRFVPQCATGPCGRTELIRARAGGSDKLTLHGRSAAYFTGSGSFYAPLRCNGGLWPRGQIVPFKITLRVTSAAIKNGVDFATRVSATYTNRSRVNRTPCVAFLGHDAGRYHGHLISAPNGGSGLSGRSPAGS